jgi:hypothetical protein
MCFLTLRHVMVSAGNPHVGGHERVGIFWTWIGEALCGGGGHVESESRQRENNVSN